MTISHPKEVKLNIFLGKDQLHSKLKPHYSARERFPSTLAAYDIYNLSNLSFTPVTSTKPPTYMHINFYLPHTNAR